MRLLGPALALVFLSFALAWSVFNRSGVSSSDWSVTLLITGSVCLFYWLFTHRIHRAPPLNRWLKWTLLLLIGYVLFQLIPLPMRLLGTLSPTRLTLTGWLTYITPEVTAAPLAITPATTLKNLLDLLTYISTFLLLRELSWRWLMRPWIPVIPLIVLAALEAAIGMVQVLTGSPMATGTFPSHDHYPGFLEMILPLTLMYGLAILRRSAQRFESALGPAVDACIAWAVAALMFMAILYSLSRSAFIVTLCTLFFICPFSIGPKLPSARSRSISVGVVAAALAVVLVLSPPDQLINRFGQLSAIGEPNGDARLQFWAETLLVIGDFRWFGLGLGGLDSALYAHQNVVNNLRIGWAHNDYLQLLAELGVVGFTVLLAAVSCVVAPVFRAILKVDNEDRRLIVIGCAGAFVAILLHSVIDFNLYVPVNAMTLAWVAGVGSLNARD